MSGGTNVGYKSVWESIERNAPKLDSDKILVAAKYASDDDDIHDDEAALIDKAVSRIGRRNSMLYRIIKKFYLRKKSVDEIAKYYLTLIEFPE